jgi:HSP20 family protein
MLKDFFGNSNRSGNSGVRKTKFISGEEEDRNIDFIEDEKNVYLIFELPGFSEKDIDVKIKGDELKIVAMKKGCDLDKIQDYLSQKLCKGIKINKLLPKFIKTKNFEVSFKNGILEVLFDKK